LKPEAGSWILDTGYWILDAGYWMLDAGNQKLKVKKWGLILHPF